MRKWMLLLEGGAAAEWLEDGTASGPCPGYDKSITYPEGDAMIVLKDGKSGGLHLQGKWCPTLISELVISPWLISLPTGQPENL